MKHGIAALMLGVGAFVLAWFQTGPRTRTSAERVSRRTDRTDLVRQAVLLGLLQGVSELFPISSLGHSVILPSLLGWDIHQNDDFFVTFLVATHLATALVLLGFFWRDWVRIVRGLGRSLRNREIGRGQRRAARLAAGRRHDPGRAARAAARARAARPVRIRALGCVLPDRERRHALRRGASAAAGAGRRDGGRWRRADRASGSRWRGAIAIGAAQALALMPGISRSGATMGGGLGVGLSNEDAARFAFLLATPIIGAAAMLKLPDLFGASGDGVRGPALVGAVCSARDGLPAPCAS